MGRLWVQDFDSGMLLYDDATGTFSRQPGPPIKGTGVGVDTARNRTWLLHYTDGLYLVEYGEVSRTFDLSEGQNMRDMLLDDDGSVWVATWGGLVHLREIDGEWQQAKYLVE